MLSLVSLTVAYCWLTSSGVGPANMWMSMIPPMHLKVTAGAPSGSSNKEYSGQNSGKF